MLLEGGVKMSKWWLARGILAFAVLETIAFGMAWFLDRFLLRSNFYQSQSNPVALGICAISVAVCVIALTPVVVRLGMFVWGRR